MRRQGAAGPGTAGSNSVLRGGRRCTEAPGVAGQVDISGGQFDFAVEQAIAALRPGAVKEGTPFFLGLDMRPVEPLCSFFL
ncbi:hypothetical protein [Streptomyces scabichelini]|uniref:hypothetical protein n=1 Tax=Streptomyces scabichelini TaxID=2711217 RepID=UPI0019D2CC4D|nr:hypothetical protein [Streptomyces scabichelini]